MKIIPTMPTDGQFVAIHAFEGNLYGTTYRYEDGELFFYTEDEKAFGVDNDWAPVSSDGMDFEEMNRDVEILGYIVQS